MAKGKILVVDDEQLIRWTLSEALRGWGYEPLLAETAAGALAAFDSEIPLAILLDINLPDGSGLDVLRSVKHREPDTVVIMITANVMLDDTLAALRGGAYDFIGKPINLDELHVAIRNGLETRQLRLEVSEIRQERAAQFSFANIVGQSPTMRETLKLARKVADSEVSSVLLQGESGTGKDLIAKAMHYESRRAEKPFVAINCAAIPATLLESELFGYEKGAFTDAKARKPGIFEQAEGGTLFLDEIGELELSLQAKLLRVLEESCFRRVGGLKDLPLDVRVIAASNRDLKAASAEGEFRLDLYYRLSVIQLDIPPLRLRGDDVLLLAQRYINELGQKMRRRIQRITPEAATSFRQYAWPGNVRELRNVIERSLILEDSDQITTRYLPPALLNQAPPRDSAEAAVDFRLPAAGIALEAVEDSLVKQAMTQSNGNQTVAARLLGISRDQLRYRLKKLQ